MRITSVHFQSSNIDYICKECKNWMKNDRVMPIRRSRVKVAGDLFWAGFTGGLGGGGGGGGFNPQLPAPTPQKNSDPPGKNSNPPAPG